MSQTPDSSAFFMPDCRIQRLQTMYFEQCENVIDTVPNNIVWIYTSHLPMYD